MNTFTRSLRGLTLAVVAWTVGTGFALADSPMEEVRIETVSYADLDLRKPAGADTLYRRLQVAAISVCGSAPAGRDFTSRRVWQECYDDAIADAVARVDRPRLTALHLAKTRAEGKSPTRIAAR